MAEDESNPQRSIGELVRLSKAYALQETVDPIKGLGKFIGIGVAAAILGGASVILVLLGILRILQTETGQHLTGSLTWVPYVVTLAIAVICMAIALGAVAQKKGRNS